MPTRRDLANALRVLSMDAVQQANSGHPGMPMGMADIAEVLWRDFLKHSPGNPAWPDRDRFVVSNGHGSMLLYSLLHLTGYPLDVDQLRNFRQLGAHTAGHPERDVQLGIETTTGPLGQGLANAVGMALAEKLLGTEFNRPGHLVVDHHTWVFLGDGCLMEGISHEACALAGTWGLGKLICFYDDNGISIDGEVHGWFTDDTPRRFEAYGWQVIRDVDGHDPEALIKAVRKARRETSRPSLICCKTIIGFGAPTKQGREECHGAALGAEEVARARETLGWHHLPFEVPQEIRDAWDARSRGRRVENKWKRAMKAYREAHPELAAELERRLAGRLGADALQAAAAHAVECQAKRPAQATRQASQAALNALGPHFPELLGGSADLTGSNLTRIAGSAAYTRERGQGRYLHYGVREFGMAAIMNGIALHGGFIPYGGTFLVFADYARNAIRMSALMGAGVIHVLTHDSIGLGEDGPTHQPVEQLASLRLIPGLDCWRPGDAAETAVAWQAAIERRHGPSCLVLTRQAVPHQARDERQLESVARGGYVLIDCDGTPECVLIGTGSELELAVQAAGQLSAAGRRVRVVSMPCVERFAAQDEAWRDAVLPPAVTARVAVEAGATQCWWRWVGSRGRVIGLDRFGASAPAKQLFEHFGITAEAVAEAARQAMDA